MERLQAINQLNLAAIKCNQCSHKTPTYRLARTNKPSLSLICMNCLKKNKSIMVDVEETFKEGAMKIIDKMPTPDYFQAESCLKLAQDLEKETVKTISTLTSALKQLEWKMIQICKKTSHYCESYIDRLNYFASLNFEDWEKAGNKIPFDAKKVIDQNAYLINIRSKATALQSLKAQLSNLQLKLPDLSQVDKKEHKKEVLCDIPITAMINVKGRNYFGTADGLIIYDGFDKRLSHKGHDSMIRSFAYDGQYTIYSSSDDFSIKAWDIHDNKIKLAKTFRKMEDYSSYHRNICVMDHGEILVSTRGQFDEYKIRLWDIQNDFDNVGTLSDQHNNFIRGMVNSKNKIFTISDDKSLKVWKMESSKPILSKSFNAKMTHIEVNQNYRLIMVADDTNRISILNMLNLEVVGGWTLQRKVVCTTQSHEHIILATNNSIGMWKWDGEKVHNIELQTIFTPTLMIEASGKLIVTDGKGTVHEYPLP